MATGQLVWVGDRFAPAELVQLREDRERKALAWLDEKLAGTSGGTKAAITVLVVPEKALAADVLLDLRKVGRARLDPPLGFGDGLDGVDAEGRYFTSQSRPGRVKILRNGIVEGIAWLNAHTDADQRIEVAVIRSNVEDNVRAYMALQRRTLDSGGHVWLMLTLEHTDGLGANLRNPAQTEKVRIAVPRLVLPAIKVDTSGDANAADVAVEQAVERLFAIVYDAFGV